MPLNVAPSGRVASAAPVTPASCAATGAGATKLLASPSIAANRNPSRVICSPSAATLLVDLDVPACEHAAFSHHVVRDPEHVIVFAGIPMVLDVRHEHGRVAVRAAVTREVRRGGVIVTVLTVQSRCAPVTW